MLKSWFKHPLVIISFLIPILICLSFIYGLIPGFNKATTSEDQMQVAIVNQDNNEIANTVTNNLKSNLPVKKVITNDSLSTAKNRLKDNRLSLVIVIPKNFSNDAKSSQPINLNYYTSSAANTVEQSATNMAIKSINNQVKSSLQSNVIVGMFARQMAPQIQNQIKQQAMQKMQNAQKQPSNMAAMQTQMRKQAQQQVMKRAQAAAKRVTVQYSSNTYQVGTKRTNKEYQMAGMFLSMGQYLGLALASAVLVWLFSAARFTFNNKYTTFGMVQLTGLLMTFVLSLIAVCAGRTLIKFNFGSVFMYNWLIDLAFFEFAIMWAFLCNGLPSLIIQIPLFTTQVIAGAGILPTFAMPKFYQWLSNYTPMHSAMQGNAHLIHEIGAMGGYISSLWWILAISLVISFCIVWLGYRSKEPKGLAKVIPFN